MIAAHDNLLFGLLSDMFRVCSLTSKKAPEFLRLQYRFEYPLFYSICSSAFAQLVCDCICSDGPLPHARGMILKCRIVQHFRFFALLVQNGFITQADASALLQELFHVFRTAANVDLMSTDHCVVMMAHAILMSLELPYEHDIAEIKVQCLKGIVTSTCENCWLLGEFIFGPGLYLICKAQAGCEVGM